MHRLRSVLSVALLCATTFGAGAEAPRVAATAANWPAPALSSRELLGRELFFDTTLSNPEGQACASCHAPEAGFTFPDSQVNAAFGVATGAIRERVTSRRVPTISYAAFIPKGPPSAHFTDVLQASKSEHIYIGGMFWDGHAADLEEQATFPFQNPNEMNDLVHDLGSPGLVVRKVENGPYADHFRQVFGDDVFDQSIDVVFADICSAIATYERSSEVSPFSSKFDAWVAGQATLTPEELDGLRLMTGTTNGKTTGPPYRKNANCILCHGIEDDPTFGPSQWTFFCYANLGVPKNRHNPFYGQTDSVSNPVGYNPLGVDFIDYGLGDFLYPINGLPPGNIGPGSDGYGDWLSINAAFKAPTLRNVDKRPSASFVRAYMHNGAFKSLKEVVHFYNTRNLTTQPGEVIDFTAPDPYANLKGTPLWPPPEISSPESLINPTGISGRNGGEIGNLGLTDAEEDHIVAFMQALTDGFVGGGN